MIRVSNTNQQTRHLQNRKQTGELIEKNGKIPLLVLSFSTQPGYARGKKSVTIQII